MIEPGTPLPPFSLSDHDGNVVSTDVLLGSWYLLYWYPKADTPGCTAQAIGLRDQQDAFDHHGCAVLGASFDQPADNAAFRERYSLTFPLLSDLDHTAAMAQGAADADTSHPRRIAHLVDPSGKVARSYDVEDPEFFAELVLDDLEQLIDG